MGLIYYGVSMAPLVVAVAGPMTRSESTPAPAREPGNRRPLFPLGRLLSTPGALAACTEARVQPLTYIARHVTGDWGELPPEDVQSNEIALKRGGRLFSGYTLPTSERLWVITEADRSATTLLLPQEY